MANETLYAGQIDDLLPLIWESALWYAKANFVVPQYVTRFGNMSGMVPRKVSAYKETSPTDNLGETDDLSTARQVFDRDLLSTLTPKEVGHQLLISDRRIETDTENVLADAAMEIGYVMGKKLEKDLLSLFSSFEGGVVGSPSGSMSLEKIFEARAVFEGRNVPGPYTVVLHPFHYLDIHAALTSMTNAAPLNVRNEAMSSYYVGRIADLSFVVSSLVPQTAVTNEVQTVEITGTPTGGTFKLSFLGWETSALAHNVSAANMQTALRALPSINGANVSVSLSSSTYTITFSGTLAGQNVALLVLSDNSLTGGTTPSATITQATAGVGYATSGIFTRDSLALDMRRNLRIERERDASLRAWELNTSTIYAVGTWRAERGIRLVADATSPTAD